MNQFELIKEEIISKANKVEEAWLKQENSFEAFPQVVLEEFKDFDFSYFSEIVNLPEILEDSATRKLQEPSSFSDLYYKIFDNGFFWIEVLNWWGLDINIHDHDFSAVQFQLKGESLNTVYEFEENHRIPNLKIGEFKIKRVELWKPGSYSIVVPGNSEPHNVVHLNLPTVSLLIRTYPNPSYGPQNNYFPPQLKIDYGLADNYFRKKISLLRLLSKGNSNDFEKTFLKIVKKQNSGQNLLTLIKTSDILYTKQNLQILLEAFDVENNPIHELLVEAGSYFKNVTFLTYVVKNVPGLTQNDFYLIGILICSFDNHSFEQVLEEFQKLHPAFDFEGALENIEKCLPTEQFNQFKNCFKLFGIEEKYFSVFNI